MTSRTQRTFRGPRARERGVHGPQQDERLRQEAAQSWLKVASWIPEAERREVLDRIGAYERGVLRQRLFGWRRWAAWCAAEAIEPEKATASKVSAFLNQQATNTVAGGCGIPYRGPSSSCEPRCAFRSG